MQWEDPLSYAGLTPNRRSAFHVGAESATIGGFCGSIDELQVFNQALTADDVRQLTIDSATALHLPLDEAPGSTMFQDTRFSGLQARCGGNACPTAGVDGRVQPAAWFTSAARQYLLLPNNTASQASGRLAVAAWIKPTTLSGVQRHHLFCAHEQRATAGVLALTAPACCSRPTASRTICSPASALQADRWYHVAAVLDQRTRSRSTLTASARGTVTGTAAGNADKDDALLIGATTAAGSSTPVELFNGLIDDVWVFTWPVGAAGIDQLYAQAPVMHLRFDEARGVTRFADVAHPDVYATC